MTEEQAAEVIFCSTDIAYWSSNRKDHDKRVLEILGVPFEETDGWPNVRTDPQNWYEMCDSIYHGGYVDYLRMERISTCYVGGLHGFIEWDGTISNHFYNVGKWPSASEILDELEIIATRFPFLDLRFQIVDWEYDDSHERTGEYYVHAEYIVKNGSVTMVEDPADQSIIEGKPWTSIYPTTDKIENMSQEEADDFLFKLSYIDLDFLESKWKIFKEYKFPTILRL